MNVCPRCEKSKVGSDPLFVCHCTIAVPLSTAQGALRLLRYAKSLSLKDNYTSNLEELARTISELAKCVETSGRD